MKNMQFLAEKEKDLADEELSFLILEKGKFRKTVDERKINAEQGLAFVSFKREIISFIKNSDESALLARIEKIKARMCPQCRTGLKTFEVKCNRDYFLFIAAEYIIRSLQP